MSEETKEAVEVMTFGELFRRLKSHTGCTGLSVREHCSGPKYNILTCRFEHNVVCGDSVSCVISINDSSEQVFQRMVECYERYRHE